MKAMEIPRFVLVVIAAIITLLVLLGLYSYGKELYEKGTLENTKFTSYKPYVFNITNLLADNNAFSAAQQDNYLIGGVDPQFCKDLRNCIEMNIKGGKRCEIVYKVRPGTPFNPQRIADALAGSCTTRDVKEELYEGTGRKLCKMKPVTTFNKLKENDIRLLDYEPYLHNCYLPTSLGTHNVLGDVNSLNYIYSGRGTVNGYSFENGGMVRIVVTNVSVMNDFDASCSYSVYVCGQNAIADIVDETSAQVFKTVQTLDDKEVRDLYFNETIYWGGATPKMPDGLTVDMTTAFISPIMWFFVNLLNLGGVTKPTINNLYGFNPRSYEFTIDGACQPRGTCKEALIDAVDAGMWEWNKINYENKKKTRYFYEIEPDARYVYFSYLPFENIVNDNTIDFTSGCWKSDFETSNAYERLEIDGPTFENSDNLKHNFNLNNFNFLNAGDRIKMTLGIKKMFILNDEFTATIRFFGIVIWSSTYSLTEDIRTAPDPDLESFDPRVILVMDPITFCRE